MIVVGAGTAWFARPSAVDAAGPRGKDFESSVREAYSAFMRGDYISSETLWTQATEDFPGEPLAWQNLATVLIINASSQSLLGEQPTGEVDSTTCQIKVQQ